MIKIYTIGLSGKNADVLRDVIDAARIKKVCDIRLWRNSRFVPWVAGTNLQKLLGDKYTYMPELAPTPELLAAYKAGEIDWAGYTAIFNNLMQQRRVENLFTAGTVNGACFVCSEKSADKCHRRLVAEYLANHFTAEISHL